MAEEIRLPRLSDVTALLAEPEISFETTVESSIGVRPPPGPMSVLLSIQRSIESSIGAKPIGEALSGLRLPRLDELAKSLPRLPLPKIELPPVGAEKVETPRPAEARAERLEGRIF